MEKVKVLVVEDDSIWLETIVNLLRKTQDITVVGTAFTKETAIQLAQTLEIDVVLMDINLNENKCDGIYAAAEIRQFKNVKIIMLTCFDDEEIIKDSFIAGAVNYVSKLNYEEIPNAIRNTYNSHSPIEVLLKDYSRLKEEEQLNELTLAEKEIYRLIEKGYTQSYIEKTLHKSKNTLKKQISSILKKLGASTSKEAIRLVQFKGLFKKDE